MRITTWNVNSIRRRIDAVLRWAEAKRPDVLCLQETKCTEDQFPWTGFASLGYTHSVVRQSGYNGVAIVSRSTQSEVDTQSIPMPGAGASGHAAVTLVL